MPSQVNTYYFNASDSGPTDPLSAWTNDANAFDTSLSTYASITSGGGTNYLTGVGTNAPTASPYGTTIDLVRMRVYGNYTGSTQTLFGGARSEGANLTANAQVTSATPAWGSWVDVSVPTGGWTWAKIQSLECRFTTATISSGEVRAYAAEIEVTTSTTINNFWGAETGGLEELYGSSGSPTASSAYSHSGAYSWLSGSNADVIQLNPFESVASGGSKSVFGFWFKTGSTGTFGNTYIARLTDGTNVDFTIESDGGAVPSSPIYVKDSTGTTRITSSTTILDFDTEYFIELYVDRSDSGSAELFINGASEGTDASGDYNAITGTPYLELRASATADIYFDDIYFMSGAAGASDRLGGCEVLAYRSNLNSATGDGGDTLDSGTWADAQNVPFNDSSLAVYLNSSQQTGYVTTNDVGGSAGTGGPNTDANITGTIQAVKGVWRMARDGGGGTIHYGRIGVVGGGADYSRDLDPTTSLVTYTEVWNDTIIPTASQYGFIGTFKSSGGQNFECSDMLYQILHVPSGSTAVTVSPTGVEAAGAVGSVIVPQDVTVSPTGLEASAAVGSVTVVTSIPATVPVTGLQAAGAVGSVTEAGKANVPVTGVEAAGAVGTATTLNDCVFPVTGLEATSAVGSVNTGVSVTFAVTGVEAAGQVGSVTVAAKAIVPLTGLEAAGQVAAVTELGKANVPVTGVAAGGAVGAATVGIGATCSVSGLSANGSVGSVSIMGKANALPTGVEAAGQAGTTSETGKANVPVTGLETTGAVGSVSVRYGITASVTGVAAAGQIGDVTESGKANVTLTGQAASGAVGTVAVLTGADAIVQVAGLQANAAVGTATASLKADVAVTGVAATASVGSASTTGKASVPVTGVEAAGQVGAVTTVGKAVVTVNGLSAVGAVGSVSVVTASETIVAVTGVAASGQVGAVTVAEGVSVYPTGVEATGAVGTTTETGKANIPVTGTAATGAVGAVGFNIPETAVVTGAEGTGAVGSVTVAGDALVAVSGVEAGAAVGSVTEICKCVVTVTGVAANGEVGQVSAGQYETAQVTGVEATGAVGSVSIAVGNTVAISTGVAATGATGNFLVLARRVPRQKANWVEIDCEAA